jgi:hypothetical protein
LVDFTDMAAAREALTEVATVLVAKYGDVAGTASADWFNQVREAAGAFTRYEALPAAHDDAERIAATVRRAIGNAEGGDLEALLTSLRGPLARYIRDAGWKTITENTDRDPDANGWQRNAKPGACRFCRFLANRGAVYKKRTVNFAAHNECDCGASPNYNPDAVEVPAAAYQASQRTSKMTPAQKAQHNADLAYAIDAFDPGD